MPLWNFNFSVLGSSQDSRTTKLLIYQEKKASKANEQIVELTYKFLILELK